MKYALSNFIKLYINCIFDKFYKKFYPKKKYIIIYYCHKIFGYINWLQEKRHNWKIIIYFACTINNKRKEQKQIYHIVPRVTYNRKRDGY